jgi:phosphopantothenate-cysteine ligase
MKILITSGGTKVKIDQVRHIANMSTGRFGTDIATEALEHGAEVFFFHAENSRHPFKETYDFREPKNFAKLAQEKNYFVQKYSTKFRDKTFADFSEYEAGLKELLTTEHFDIIFVAAAVSDYSPEAKKGKIPSDMEKISLELSRLPKIIKKIKTWQPSIFQVGFKLLVNSTPEQLILTAIQAGEDNHSDLTVANDLSTLDNGNHIIHLVEGNKVLKTIGKNIAAELVSSVLYRYNELTDNKLLTESV